MSLSSWKKITTLALLSIPYAASAQPTCVGDWISSGTSGNWSDGLNWDCTNSPFCPCIPGDSGNPEDFATFGQVTPAGDVTVTLDLSLMGGVAAVNNMSLTNPGGFNYTFVQQSTEELHFVAGDASLPCNLTVYGGSHTFDVPVGYFSSSFTITFINQSTLTFTNSLTSSNSSCLMTITGPGSVSMENSSANVGPITPVSGSNYSISSSVTPVTPFTSSSSVTTTDITVGADGTVTLSNIAAISNDGTTGSLVMADSVTVDSLTERLGTYQHLNVADVGGVSWTMGGYGTKTRVASDTTVTNAHLFLQNNGHISGGVPDLRDSVGGSYYQNAGNFFMNSGFWNQTNNGWVQGANTFGALTVTEVKHVMAGGVALHENYGQVNLPDGTNTDVIYGVGHRIKGDYQQFGGTAEYTNWGTVTGAGADPSLTVGTMYVVEGSHTQYDGFFSLCNYGRVSFGGIGVAGEIGDFFAIYGGTFRVASAKADPIVGQKSFGSLGKVPVTYVNGGMFIIDDTWASDFIHVYKNGTMAGNGYFYDFNLGYNTQVYNRGTNIVGDPAPGGAPGTMTINGTYTQTDTGVLVINVLDNNDASELIVTGTASIAGELLVGATPGFDVTPGVAFPILEADGGLSGTFDSVVGYNLPSYVIPQVLYFPDLAELIFSPNVAKYVRLQQPVFSSVNETNMRLQDEMGRLRGHFAKKTQNASIPKKPAKKAVSVVEEEVSMQLVANSPKKKIAATTVEQEKTQRLTETLGAEMPWNFYIGPKGQIGNVLSKEDTQQGYSDWSAGFFTGVDYAWSQVGLGLLAEYERATAHAGKGWGRFTIDNVRASLYSTYAPESVPEFSLQGIVGGGYDFYSIHRNIGNPENQTAKGSPGAGEFDAFFGLEYAIRKSNVSGMPMNLQIIPLASVQFMYLMIGEYKEKGAGSFDMKVHSQDPKSLRTSLGFRVNDTWNWTNVSFSPEVAFAWQREYLDKGQTIDFTPISTPEYGISLKLPRVGRNIALAGVDLLLTLYKRHGIEAGYNFEYNSMYHTHFMYMSYNIRF